VNLVSCIGGALECAVPAEISFRIPLTSPLLVPKSNTIVNASLKGRFAAPRSRFASSSEILRSGENSYGPVLGTSRSRRPPKASKPSFAGIGNPI
jgi:hypothetical protein